MYHEGLYCRKCGNPARLVFRDITICDETNRIWEIECPKCKARYGKWKTREEALASEREAKTEQAMEFPETWEEFAETYGYVDKSRKIFVGDIEVIPRFRVEQWLSHISTLQNTSTSSKRVQFTGFVEKDWQVANAHEMLMTLDASYGEEENILRFRLTGEKSTIESIRWYLVKGGKAVAFTGAWKDEGKKTFMVHTLFLGCQEYWPSGLTIKIIE